MNRDEYSIHLYSSLYSSLFITVFITQCVAVCCSVSQCVAVCCSVLQCVAVCCSMLQCFRVRCSVLQCVAVCCVVHNVSSSTHVCICASHTIHVRNTQTHTCTRTIHLYSSLSTDGGDIILKLKTITTTKISNEFSRESPYISNTFSRESSNFQANFHVSKRSPRHSKDLTGKLLNLEIQIISVWSPPWVTIHHHSSLFVTHSYNDSYHSHDSYVWHICIHKIHLSKRHELYLSKDHQLNISCQRSAAPRQISFIRWVIMPHVIQMIHMCDMTHSYVWHDSFTCVTWLIHMCDMTHLHVWHDSFICVTWLIHMCDMTHSYGW